MEQGYICNPEPMNFTDSESDLEELVGLTTEQRKTKELCMNFGMEAAFKIFNGIIIKFIWSRISYSHMYHDIP